MQRRNVVLGVAILASSALLPEGAWADAYRTLDWSDLLPKGEAALLAREKLLALRRAGAHGSLDDESASLAEIQPGTFNTVPGLDGVKARLRGFVVPLDYSAGKFRELLLVPYYGACIHAPPPPPNQTLHVRSDEAVRLRALSDAVEVEGRLTVAQNASPMGASAYAMRLDRMRVVT